MFNRLNLKEDLLALKVNPNLLEEAIRTGIAENRILCEQIQTCTLLIAKQDELIQELKQQLVSANIVIGSLRSQRAYDKGWIDGEWE